MSTDAVETTPPACTSTDTVSEEQKKEMTVQAINLLAQGKRNLLCQEIPTAVDQLQEASKLFASAYGEMAKGCAESYLTYGRALLELARMENGVLGNALQGVPSEEEGDLSADDQFEKTDGMKDEERLELRKTVCDALSTVEEEKVTGSGDTDDTTEKMEADGDVEGSGDGKKTEDKPDGCGISKVADGAGTEKKATDGDKSEKKEADTVEETEDVAKSEGKDKEEKSEEKDPKSEDKPEQKSEEKSEKVDAAKKTEDKSDVKEDEKETKSEEKTEKSEEKGESMETDASTNAKPEDSSQSKDGEKPATDTTKEDGTKTDDANTDGSKTDGADKTGDEGKSEDDKSEEGDEEGDEESMDEDGEDTAEGPESCETENPDDISNFQLAWEMLELARIIYLKEPEEKTQIKASEACMMLGEISLETEQYEKAIEDITKCLDIQKTHLEGDNRLIAETHYQLGLAYLFNAQHREALKNLEIAIDVIKTKVEKLKAVTDAEGKEETDVDNPVLKAATEIKELGDILPEIVAKVEDVKEEMKNFDAIKTMAKEAFANAVDSVPELQSSDKKEDTSEGKVHNIGHLIRKKRKPDEDDTPADDNEAKKSRPSDVAQTTETEKKPTEQTTDAEKPTEKATDTEKPTEKVPDAEKPTEKATDAEKPREKAPDTTQKPAEEIPTEKKEDKKADEKVVANGINGHDEKMMNGHAPTENSVEDKENQVTTTNVDDKMEITVKTVDDVKAATEKAESMETSEAEPQSTT